MTDLFGPYQLRARLHPILLAAFPAAAVAFALGAPDERLSQLTAALAAFGVTSLLTAMARDRGQGLQSALWQSWGGPPTATMLLSTSTPPPSSLEVHRRHLQRLLPDAERLTDERDVADPVGTRGTIERYTTYLRERTRDRARFPIVFDANVGYGFRRNILGLKPVGLAIAGGSAAVAGVALVLVATSHLDRSATGLAVAGIVSVIAVALWLRATPSWVKVEADRYATALLAAAEALDTPSTPAAPSPHS